MRRFLQVKQPVFVRLRDPRFLKPASLSASPDRTASLQAELAAVQRMNAVISNLLSSLHRAKANMSTVQQTVSNASRLLDTYTRILAQAEHNQRLLLHPEWKGASDDLAHFDDEVRQRDLERERREREERLKAEERERKRRVAEEEEERRRQVPTTPGRRGSVRARAGLGAGGSSRGFGGHTARGSVSGIGRPVSVSGRSVASVDTSSVGESRAERAARGRAAVAHYGRVRGSVGRAGRGRGGS